MLEIAPVIPPQKWAKQQADNTVSQVGNQGVIHPPPPFFDRAEEQYIYEVATDCCVFIGG